MADISGYGLRVEIKASNTFPSGFTVSAFADDADPIDNPAVDITGTGMGLNGNLVTWGQAQPIVLTLNVIPGTDDDRNLRVLGNANVTSLGSRPARDVITATVSYPDGRTVTLTGGAITNFVRVTGVASGGRQKTTPYVFAFETSTEALA